MEMTGRKGRGAMGGGLIRMKAKKRERERGRWRGKERGRERKSSHDAVPCPSFSVNRDHSQVSEFHGRVCGVHHPLSCFLKIQSHW